MGWCDVTRTSVDDVGRVMACCYPYMILPTIDSVDFLLFAVSLNIDLLSVYMTIILLIIIQQWLRRS